MSRLSLLISRHSALSSSDAQRLCLRKSVAGHFWNSSGRWNVNSIPPIPGLGGVGTMRCWGPSSESGPEGQGQGSWVQACAGLRMKKAQEAGQGRRTEG